MIARCFFFKMSVRTWKKPIMILAINHHRMHFVSKINPHTILTVQAILHDVPKCLYPHIF